MKKLEIVRVDPTTQEQEVITLVSEYGILEEDWMILTRMMNEAEPEQWLFIKFGQSSALIRRGEISYIVESNVNVGSV